MSPHFESPPPDPSAPPAPAPLNLTRPTPRPPRSASQSARVRILNRRREYLARHPSYMASAADNELADPVLYDSLVRRFQTPTEREAEGRRRGYGHVLESSLLRSEAATNSANAAATGIARLRVAAALDPDTDNTTTTNTDTNTNTTNTDNNNNNQGETIFSVDADLDAPPADRAEARARWLAFLRDRFVAGRDDDFDYAAVDGDDDYDVLERRDAEDAWFDGEEPSWDDDDDDDDDDHHDDDDDGAEDATRKRRGETGIQDY